ncbi:MAG TPA: hypothetical protein VK698_37400 [Kofleriaceae bacterium]|nr:hypothetical protein [Kofleriaceae bacterium]
MTKHRFSSLVVPCLAGLFAGAFGPGCNKDRDKADDTRMAIEETKDDVAEARAKIQDKGEELASTEGDTASDRAQFIAATERNLTELDGKIEELRASVTQRSTELEGEARTDLEQGMRDLEGARRQAQSALDSFRQTTSGKAADVRQATETAVERTRAAYDALHGRVSEPKGSIEHVKVEKK